MRAAVYRGGGVLRTETVPIPEIGDGELLVKVEACGVCGTDIKKIVRDLLPGPRIYGHETAGTVARVGVGVSRFREGDRVALHHHIPCRRCYYCERRTYAQCEGYKRNGTTAGFEAAGGGFSEYVRVMDWIVREGTIAIPDGVAPEEAAFIEPVNTVLKAVERAGVEEGQTALVVGQGPIGLILTQAVRWKGARVIATEVREDRLGMSRELGADPALQAASAPVEAVRRLSGGKGADVAFVAALGQEPLDQAIDATRPGGRIMLFAATSPGETAEVDLGALCASEKDIMTSYSASVDVQELAAQLVFERAIRVKELITHRFGLDEAARAIELAANPVPGVLKVMLRPGDPGPAA